MIFTACLLLAIALPAIWMFVRACPTTSRSTALRRFNIGTLCVVALAMISVVLYFRLTTGESVDWPWWPYLAIGGAVFSGSVVLVAGTLLRYLVFGRDSTRV